jgi:hypothetical protein
VKLIAYRFTFKNLRELLLQIYFPTNPKFTACSYKWLLIIRMVNAHYTHPKMANENPFL